MTKQELTNNFIDWIETITQSEFSITNDFLLVCLDEAVEQNINSTINGIKFIDYYDKETFNLHILSSWKDSSRAFLIQPDSRVQINFRGVPVPAFEYREKLLSQLYQLALICEDSQRF